MPNETTTTKLPLDRLFEQEFDKVTRVRPDTDTDTEVEVDAALGATLKDVANELGVFMSERGLKLDRAEIKSIISAMQSSRRLVLRGEMLGEFMTALSAYFGGSMDLGAARADKSRIHFAVVNDLGGDAPDNVWLVSGTDELDLGVGLYVNPRKVAERQQKTATNGISFARFTHYSQLEGYEVSESGWKKIDALEAYVNARAPYTIGNKEWHILEDYTAAYLACEIDAGEVDAIDSVIAAKLLPRIERLLEGVPTDESLLRVLERILGEDNVRACAAIRKSHPRQGN